MSSDGSCPKTFPHESEPTEPIEPTFRLVWLLKDLYSKGFNVVPVDKDKEALLSWSWKSRPSWGEIEETLKRRLKELGGIALTAGSENPRKPSCWLAIADIDDPRVLDRCRVLKELVESSVSWRTGPRCPKCYDKQHIEVLDSGRLFRCPNCVETFKAEEAPRGLAVMFYVPSDLVEKYLKGTVRGKGVELLVRNYQVIPPSIHKTGITYEWIRSLDFNEKHFGIRTLTEKELVSLLDELHLFERRWAKSVEEGGEGGEVAGRVAEGGWKRLSEEQVKRISDAVLKFYERGWRDRIIFSLLGLLVKASVDYESAKRVVDVVTTNANDEERDQRLYLVDWHYGKRVKEIDVSRFKGPSGLREIFEEVLKRRGVDEADIAKEVSEALNEVYGAIGVIKAPNTAWLKRSGGLWLEWAYCDGRGIYVFRRKKEKEGESIIVEKVSNAVLEEVKRVRVLGLDLRGLYKVKIGGESVIGTVDEIVSYIEKYYGLAQKARYAIANLLQNMAVEEERLYYSPGPWVVDGKLVLVEEPGYTPPWKEYVRWSYPKEDVDWGLKVEALLRTKRLVESYRNPAKASAVLSYGAIAPFAHYVKSVLEVVFHMIVHGLEEVGKSVLLDYLKLLYSMGWADPFPGSDYQARRCLAYSTLPAVIDEISNLIRDYAGRNRDVAAAIEVLHRAATQFLLRVGGGSQYGGYFLAVRCMISATNADISLVPWQLDKFILVEISVNDRIDVEKARGCTYRTMRPEIQKAVKRLGVELMEEVWRLLPEVEALRGSTREEIRTRLLEIGYKAWCNLYRRYGVDPFPPPAPPETQVEKMTAKEQYMDILRTYLTLARNEKLPGVVLGEVEVEDEEELKTEKCATASMQLENYGAILVRYRKGPKSTELMCKSAFLTKFAEYVHREYGLPKIGYRRLAEILGFVKTRRTIGGKLLDNLFVLELDRH